LLKLRVDSTVLACPFYEKLGYRSTGVATLRFGVLHSYPYEKTLQPLELPDRLRATLAGLRIPDEWIAARSLVFQPEAQGLVVADTDENGKEHRLVPAAASAWRAMKIAASSDGVVLRIVSAFRTIERQAGIVRAKIEKGLSLEAILCASAPPGFSEHHSGRAIDVTTDGVRPLEAEFEHTRAFFWLSTNAGRFGFALSYPPNNRYGYTYEPWHWCFETAKV
jgi:zinc D-Ala-D-Ala carboxypeptidase